MDANLIGRRYATALYRLAKKERIEYRLETELKMIRRRIEEYPDWGALLADHFMPFSEKCFMLNEFAEVAGIHRHTLAFLKILIEERRMIVFEEVYRAFNKLWREGRGEVEVVVTVAHPEVLDELKDDIQKTLYAVGKKSPIVRGKIDPEIIGGLRIRIGDVIYDGSIREQLRKVRRDLLVDAEAVS